MRENIMIRIAGRFRRMGRFAMLVLLTVVAEAADWPQWRGPDRDGVWNETGIMESFPAGGLPVAWRVPVGRGRSSPVVVHGRVYITDVQLVLPTATERVLCLDEDTGRLLWSHQYAVDYPDFAFRPDGGGPNATPIVRDGRLFTIGALGHLFCLDAVSGKVVWEKNLGQEYGVKPFSGASASPLIEDGLLILSIGGKPSAAVVAFDRDSGREVWRALDDSFTYSSPIIVTAGGKKQLIVWTQEAVNSLHPDTGEIWWREMLRTSSEHAVSTPVFSGHRLLVAGLMLKLDPDRPAASVLWPETKALSKRILSNTSTALLQGEHVFSAKTSGELVCFEALTGKQVWQADTVTELRSGSSIHLTPCGDAVFLFTDRGDFIRAKITPRAYRETARAHLLEPTSAYGNRKCVWTPPSYANRHVFARNDEELVCVSLAAKP